MNFITSCCGLWGRSTNGAEMAASKEGDFEGKDFETLESCLFSDLSIVTDQETVTLTETQIAALAERWSALSEEQIKTVENADVSLAFALHVLKSYLKDMSDPSAQDITPRFIQTQHYGDVVYILEHGYLRFVSQGYQLDFIKSYLLDKSAVNPLREPSNPPTKHKDTALAILAWVNSSCKKPSTPSQVKLVSNGVFQRAGTNRAGANNEASPTYSEGLASKKIAEMLASATVDFVTFSSELKSLKAITGDDLGGIVGSLEVIISLMRPVAHINELKKWDLKAIQERSATILKSFNSPWLSKINSKANELLSKGDNSKFE